MFDIYSGTAGRFCHHGRLCQRLVSGAQRRGQTVNSSTNSASASSPTPRFCCWASASTIFRLPTSAKALRSSYEGKTVHQIAKELHMNDLDAYLMLCEQSNFSGRVNMGPYSTPGDRHRALPPRERAVYDGRLGRGARRAEPRHLRLFSEVSAPLPQRQGRYHAPNHAQDDRRGGRPVSPFRSAATSSRGISPT